MRIRGGRGRGALPPDVESSNLQPLTPLRHLQTHLQPSPPPTKSSISFEQDASIGTGEDEDPVKGKNPVATKPCGSIDAMARDLDYHLCRMNWPLKYDCNLSSETAADTDSSICSPSSRDGRWLEEDKALPLKKRRLVQLDLKGKEPSNTTLERELKNSNETRAKRKRTEKIWTDYVLQVDCVAEKARHQKTRDMNERCSRQNGRGWRCSSPAFAGHNLCEHHFTEHQRRTRKK